MTIEKMQNILVEKIQNDDKWSELLTDTNPGNYGASFWEVELESTDIWVDVPNKKFNFKNALFSFDVAIGSSNSDDGSEDSFSREASGYGEFAFNGLDDLSIDNLKITVNLDLYD